MSTGRRLAVFGVLSVLICTPRVALRSVVADEPPAQSDLHHYFSKVEHEHGVPWGYTGRRGPEFWGTLSPQFRIAKDGKRQSPIDIQTKTAIAQKLPLLRFQYRKERISAINNGHTIQHDEQPGSFLHVGDVTYALEQFHVHVPSEHTIDGQHAAMEIHFVHKSKSGEVAVVAVLVQPGTTNVVNVPRYKDVPKEPDEVVESEHTFRNPLDYIPKDHRYVAYAGSFTTPPCTEGVRWIVMTSPVTMQPEALEEFRRAIGRNNRPVQRLYGRQVTIDTGSARGD